MANTFNGGNGIYGEVTNGTFMLSVQHGSASYVSMRSTNLTSTIELPLDKLDAVESVIRQIRVELDKYA